MQVINILDQLSTNHGQPTPVVLKTNGTVFHSPYLATNAPEDLFCRIKECAVMALLGCNSYMDQQLVTDALHVLLKAGLYTQRFKDWDHLTLGAQTWIALQTMVQEAFQQRLNKTAPTAGHQGYAPAMPHQQNSFGILGQNKLDDNSVETVATQVAEMTYQSQMTASNMTNTSQHAEQQFAHLASQQNMMETGFQPVWTSTLHYSIKNYFLSVQHLYIIYSLAFFLP